MFSKIKTANKGLITSVTLLKLPLKVYVDNIENSCVNARCRYTI